MSLEEFSGTELWNDLCVRGFLSLSLCACLHACVCVCVFLFDWRIFFFLAILAISVIKEKKLWSVSTVSSL